MTWRERCPDGKHCGHKDCPRCSPTKILPSSLRGRSKPNRGGGVRGYQVHPSGEKPKEDPFSTPDMAVTQAKQRAKKEQRVYIVSDGGVQWMIVRPDGSTERA